MHDHSSPAGSREQSTDREPAAEPHEPDLWDDGEEWEDVADTWGRVFDDGTDTYVGVPKETPRYRRLVWILGGVLVFLVLVVGAVALWLGRQVDPPGEPGEEVVLEVGDGSTFTDVAGDLEELGVVSDAMVFRLYARWKGFDEVKAGAYQGLRTNSAMGDVIGVLEEGPAAPPAAAFTTVPEGLRFEELNQRLLDGLPELDEAELAAAYGDLESTLRPAGVPSWEGLLFPDTYRIEQGDEGDEAKLLRQMAGRFEEVTTELGYQDAEATTGLSAYELVILASIVEREARVPEDFPKVARVLHNRLAQGMPLEVDATLLYAIGHRETLTQSDLETDSPYNTRLYPGLPPTPIAMPGREALQAAISPVDGPWLYYVLADEEGRHFFTDDYEEFLRVAEESREQGLFE